MNNYFLQKFNPKLYLINQKYYTINLKNIKEFHFYKFFTNLFNNDEIVQDKIELLIEKSGINLLTKKCIEILLNKFNNENFVILLISNKISHEDLIEYFDKFHKSENKNPMYILITLNMFRKISDEFMWIIFKKHYSHRRLFYRYCDFNGEKYYRHLNVICWQALSHNIFIQIPEKIIERDIDIIDNETLSIILSKKYISHEFFEKYKQKINIIS